MSANQTSWKNINLFHVLVSGPLLIYIGLSKNIPSILYNLLIAISIFLWMYVLYLINQNDKRTWLIIHLLIFLPLLFWIGVEKEKAPYMVKAILLAIGCGAFGYHLIYIIQRILEKNDKTIS
jgi:FtsH-binding integral membrane protein